jgi:hypothetical protein
MAWSCLPFSLIHVAAKYVVHCVAEYYTITIKFAHHFLLFWVFLNGVSFTTSVSVVYNVWWWDESWMESWKGFGRKSLWPSLYCGTSPDGLGKSTINLRYNTRCPGRYSKGAPPEYNSALLGSLAWCVVYVSILLKDSRNYKLRNILLSCNEFSMCIILSSAILTDNFVGSKLYVLHCRVAVLDSREYFVQTLQDRLWCVQI